MLDLLETGFQTFLKCRGRLVHDMWYSSMALQNLTLMLWHLWFTVLFEDLSLSIFRTDVDQIYIFLISYKKLLLWKKKKTCEGFIAFWQRLDIVGLVKIDEEFKQTEMIKIQNYLEISGTQNRSMSSAQQTNIQTNKLSVKFWSNQGPNGWTAPFRTCVFSLFSYFAGLACSFKNICVQSESLNCILTGR